MRHLHDVRIPNQEAYVWGAVGGRNGIAIGEPRRAIWNNPLIHAFLIARGTPPPIDENVRWPNREYWYPWHGEPVTPLNPACGRLRTQARNPVFHPSEHQDWRPLRFCPACMAIQPNAGYARLIRNADPWMALPRHLRNTTPDPVTGV